jgi:hypothetical protein
MGVPEDHRAPGSDIIDIPVSIGVPDMHPSRSFDEDGRTSDTLECSNRGVDPARKDFTCSGEEEL